MLTIHSKRERLARSCLNYQHVAFEKTHSDAAGYGHAFTLHMRFSGGVEQFRETMAASIDALQGNDANGNLLTFPSGSGLLSSVADIVRNSGSRGTWITGNRLTASRTARATPG